MKKKPLSPSNGFSFNSYEVARNISVVLSFIELAVRTVCKIGLTIFCSMTVLIVQAQKKAFSFSAGAGLAYVSKKKLAPDYSPVVAASISAALMVPLSKNMFVETGIGYRRKGFKGFSRLVNDDQTDQYHTRARYDYIGIPLSLCGTVFRSKRSQLSVGGGMVYNFMLQGSTDIHHDSYIDGQLRGSYDYAFRPRIGLVQSKRKEIDLFLFDTGLKFQVGYLYHNRWLLQVFHEHSLYSFVANAHDGSTLKQRYTGLAVGVVFK